MTLLQKGNVLEKGNKDDNQFSESQCQCPKCDAIINRQMHAEIFPSLCLFCFAAASSSSTMSCFQYNEKLIE